MLLCGWYLQAPRDELELRNEIRMVILSLRGVRSVVDSGYSYRLSQSTKPAVGKLSSNIDVCLQTLAVGQTSCFGIS